MTQEILNKSSSVSEMELQYSPLPKKTRIAFGFGPLADQMSHQMFQFLVFTYYYAVVGVNINLLAASFVIFAIWDSINDPLLGPISDRTNSRFGRRGFWVLISIIPFGLINIFLFTPPYFWTNNASDIANAIYMILIIMAYDLVYSIFSVNQLALFSEMFKTEEERGEGNMWKSILTIVGVIIGFVLPTIFINPMAPSDDTPAEVVAKIPGMYVIAGIAVGILVIIAGFIFFKYGMVEDPINKSVEKKEDMPGMVQMLKETFSNKDFIVFCVANLVKWFVFKMLTTIIPLYAIHVLGVEGIMVSVLLLAAFISAAACFPLMKKIGARWGWRNGFIFTQIIWIFVLIPFWFFDGQPILAMIGMIFMGVALSGAMYFVEPILANVIDEDELKTGKASAGSYYGVNGLINRYSTILVFAAIAIVLTGYGWEDYLVGGDLDVTGLQTGLKLLLVPISIIGNVIVILLLSKYSLHGDKLKDVQDKLKEARLRKH